MHPSHRNPLLFAGHSGGLSRLCRTIKRISRLAISVHQSRQRIPLSLLLHQREPLCCCSSRARTAACLPGITNPERIRCRNDDRWTQATTAGEPPRVTTPLSPVPLTQPLLGPPVGKQHTINDWLPCPARQTGRGTPAEQRRGATPVPTLMAGSRSMGAPREPDPGLWQPRGGDHPGCGIGPIHPGPIHPEPIHPGPIHPGAVPRWSRSAGRGDATAGSAADRPVDPVGRRRRFGSSVGGRSSVRPATNGF